MTPVALEEGKLTTVGMGQIALGRDADRLQAILGSCLGVAVYCSKRRLAALAHVVLPDSRGQNAQAGKFADKAIPAIVQMFAAEGVLPSALSAKIAGGASMFDNGGPMQVGENNLQAVLAALQAAGIPVLARNVQGKKGRKVCLSCATGGMTVEIIGQPTVEI